MVKRIEVTKKGNLVVVNEKTGVIEFMAEMPKPRILGKTPRWLNGSFLDPQQKTDEDYNTKMHIA